MKSKFAVVGLILAAVLSFGSPAQAVTVDYVRDYGTDAGQTAPIYGGAGQMSDDYVTVKDEYDSGGNRFYDTISFNNSGTVNSLMLTLVISGAQWSPFFESWRVYGSTNGGTTPADRLQLGSALSNGNSWVVTLLAGSGSVFSQAISNGVFAFWFGDLGGLPNSFQLDRATLSVTTTAAVPLPAGVLLLGSGLGALGFFGWRKKHAARAPAAA